MLKEREGDREGGRESVWCSRGTKMTRLYINWAYNKNRYSSCQMCVLGFDAGVKIAQPYRIIQLAVIDSPGRHHRPATSIWCATLTALLNWTHTGLWDVVKWLLLLTLLSFLFYLEPVFVIRKLNYGKNRVQQIVTNRQWLWLLAVVLVCFCILWALVSLNSITQKSLKGK